MTIILAAPIMPDMTCDFETDLIEVFPQFSIETFTEAKDPAKPERNEDVYAIGENTIVLSDGATDKGGKINFDGFSGGQIAANIVADVCLYSDSSGYELANEANQQLRSFYNANGIDYAVELNRAAASLLCVRIAGEKIIITQVNNTGVRINGSEVFMPETICDKLHANARADYIKETGDIAGSREYIMPLLQRQLGAYQNKADKALGYGVIDGTQTPTKFIKIYERSLASIETLELFTDGYPLIPTGTNIEDWECAFREVQSEDPNRYLKYPATKLADDRTIIILRKK